MLFNMVDLGTSFQIEAVLRKGHGTPKSAHCLDVVMRWVSWVGYPKEILADRGLNARGIFCKEMSAAGIYCGSAGLEAPDQLGKVERLGNNWKKTAVGVIEAKEIRVLDQLRLLAAKVNAVMN